MAVKSKIGTQVSRHTACSLLQPSASFCLLRTLGQNRCLQPGDPRFITKSESQVQPTWRCLPPAAIPPSLRRTQRAWDARERCGTFSEKTQPPLSGLTQCSLHPKCVRGRLFPDEACCDLTVLGLIFRNANMQLKPTSKNNGPSNLLC